MNIKTTRVDSNYTLIVQLVDISRIDKETLELYI